MPPNVVKHPIPGPANALLPLKRQGSRNVSTSGVPAPTTLLAVVPAIAKATSKAKGGNDKGGKRPPAKPKVKNVAKRPPTGRKRPPIVSLESAPMRPYTGGTPTSAFEQQQQQQQQQQQYEGGYRRQSQELLARLQGDFGATSQFRSQVLLPSIPKEMSRIMITDQNASASGGSQMMLFSNASTGGGVEAVVVNTADSMDTLLGEGRFPHPTSGSASQITDHSRQTQHTDTAYSHGTDTAHGHSTVTAQITDHRAHRQTYKMGFHGESADIPE